MAAIGLYEIITYERINDFFSSWFNCCFNIMYHFMPPEWTVYLLRLTAYSKFEFTYLAVFLLAYIVVVKNHFTFDDDGFIVTCSLYIGIGFYYLIRN